MGQHEAQHLRQAFVHRLDVPLEFDVVDEEELADAGGIAAAADILEQKRIIKVRHLFGRKPDRLPDMHADPTAADTVPRRLALGHVQCVAEGAQKFRYAWAQVQMTSVFHGLASAKFPETL
jgi:hypothetical protein